MTSEKILMFVYVENWTRVSRGFLYVSYPPRIELSTLDENSKKENEKECVKAVLYIVILEYSLYSKLSCCIRFIQFTSFVCREF